MENFFTKRVVKHWNGLPRAEVELPSLERFNRNRDVMLRAMVSGGLGSAVLNDVRGLFQPE